MVVEPHFIVGIDLYLILLRRRKLLQNAYSHVRVCAQARAIENECFVVIAGSVGNLPRVHNMDIQYAQSGVFPPCDFALPTDGKRAEATPNTEMILVSDVDLDLLNELHTYGSVCNLKKTAGMTCMR